MKYPTCSILVSVGHIIAENNSKTPYILVLLYKGGVQWKKIIIWTKNHVSYQ